jgi:hypothetical protein
MTSMKTPHPSKYRTSKRSRKTSMKTTTSIKKKKKKPKMVEKDNHQNDNIHQKKKI